MRRFARLLSEIEQTNSTNEKVDLMTAFFRATDAENAAWALYFLSGRRPKKFIGSGKLRAWAEEIARVPAWLAEDCYGAVGDSAEMIALMLAPYRVPGETEDLPLATWMTERLEPLARESDDVQRRQITDWWLRLSTRETFVLNKLMTGGLRIGVSETLVYRAIAAAFELPRAVVAARLLGEWRPGAAFFREVTRPADAEEAERAGEDGAAPALPLPFCLAAPLEAAPESLGPIDDWQIEWKWDGIRAQVVKTGGTVELWSRGEERVTESFPDLVELMGRIPGDFTVDGEIVAGDAAAPASFNELQKRLNRKQPSAALLRDQPVSFLAYDYLRSGTERLTELPLAERRARLESELGPRTGPRFAISSRLTPASWEAAAELQRESRAHVAEGLMLKRRNAPYATGRKRGIWFKWKVDPLTLDLVLTAAQPGTGRRASLYTDYTFAIWKEGKLVNIAKAYSGLTDEEIASLDQWIRRHTVTRHGPVRTLKPERVFEIGFEGLGPSSRHKSGFALRFPRILRERTDKPAAEADRIETVESLYRTITEGRGAGLVRAEAPPVASADEVQPDLFGSPVSRGSPGA